MKIFKTLRFTNVLCFTVAFYLTHSLHVQEMDIFLFSLLSKSNLSNRSENGERSSGENLEREAVKKMKILYLLKIIFSGNKYVRENNLCTDFSFLFSISISFSVKKNKYRSLGIYI
ncbi:hypothetical protein ACOSQ4_017989 [Xanthoceras sorbifolium]